MYRILLDNCCRYDKVCRERKTKGERERVRVCVCVRERERERELQKGNAEGLKREKKLQRSTLELITLLADSPIPEPLKNVQAQSYLPNALCVDIVQCML